ncbi:heme lyase CcmF/NrfE family subunit [Commensalibacter sp. ESL0382]|uniref:heme lyase CcmF/NrfE family subunit n=1 Tax=unclassified Commensalibacter TaxID=2630218 RepID=UPI0012D87E33|nr:heme lyase CcmF/NrfE family subunit [Commensalibacter sp. ESL0382]MUG34214.1 heme lyase CcmF/NrfE family subunit [Commensalibacter sp. ESL0382]
MFSILLSPELGHFALALACCLAGAQFVLPLLGNKKYNFHLMNLASPLAWGQFFTLLITFICLVTAALNNDFSVQNILQNSASDKPILYKVTGIWGNHEGSILLWAFILSFFGVLFSSFSHHLPFSLRIKIIAILGGCAAGFELFCLITSNPFLRIWPTPMEGQGMNPLLQDPGLAFHPPILYTGYVGFSIPFAFAVAALMEKRIDAVWGRWIRPWVITAWVFLTAGIAIGSWWSYYVLGWGGYWFWDPVENAALIPWLTGTALLHSALIVEKREALKAWTIFLSIITFSLALCGTFLVRSGILNSVHAFASDPTRGIFILVLLTIICGGALVLFAWQAPLLLFTALFAPLSREGSIILNNILFCSLAAIILVGTLYPPVLQMIDGETISVGKPFFDKTFIPPALIAIFFMAFAPWLAFKKAKIKNLLRPLSIMGIITIIIVIASFIYLHRFLPAIATGVSFWVIMGALTDFSGKLSLFHTSFKNNISRMKNLPRSFYAAYIAHIGVAVTLLGIVGMAYSQQKIVEVPIGTTLHLAGYEWTLESVQKKNGPNYQSEEAVLKISRHNKTICWMFPARHFFPRQQQVITDVAIHTNFIADLYAVLGDNRNNHDKASVYVLRLHFNPLAPWIWIGGFIMILGGIITLIDLCANKNNKKFSMQNMEQSS